MDKNNSYIQLLEFLLTDENPSQTISDNINIVLDIIPELQHIIGFQHRHPHHHLDVWHHTLLAMEKSENDFEIRLVLLLHDIGKPFSYQDMEVRHFFGHAKVSSEIAYKVLNRLNFDEDYIEEVCKLIEMHDTIINEDQINEDKEFYEKLFKIQTCDALAHHPDKLEKRKVYLKKISNKLYENGIQ